MQKELRANSGVDEWNESTEETLGDEENEDGLNPMAVHASKDIGMSATGAVFSSSFFLGGDLIKANKVLLSEGKGKWTRDYFL